MVKKMLVGESLKKYMALPGIGALAMLYATASAAVDDYQYEGEDFLTDLPVVLTVTRLPQQTQELPASVTVIDRQMIEASGAKEIPELLRLVAGFQVGHTNMIGPRASVTYHGMSDEFARRMQVLVDGRSIYTPATGGVDWYGLPLMMEDIKRIEVTRGPNGVTYGANAFLGVINILTYHSSEQQGTLLKSTGGENGFRKSLLRHAGKSGALNYRVSMEYLSDEGNINYRHNEYEATRDDKDIKSATLRADYRSSINDYLTLQLGMSHGEVGDGMVGVDVQPPHENEVKQYFGQLKWKRIFSTDNDIELQFYQNYNDSDADYFIPKLSEIFSITPATVQAIFSHPDDPVYVPHSHEMRRNDIELIHRFRASDSMRMVWGAEARQDEMVSPGLVGQNSPVTNHLYRLFGNGEWSPKDDWLINAGVMLEQNDITDTRMSPRIAVNYRLSDTQTVRTSYSVSYRTPAMLEEYADYGARFYTDDQIIDQIWMSDGGLEPEESTSYELALVGVSTDRKMNYDIRLFRDHIKNLITVPVDTNFVEQYSSPFNCSFYPSFCSSSVMTNDGAVTLSGVEIQASLKATDNTSLSLAYSYTDAEGNFLERKNPDEYASVRKNVPAHTIAVLLDQRFAGDWSASMGHYHVANSSYIGGDETGGISATDVRLARGFSMDGLKGSLSMTIQDVDGSYYDLDASIPRMRTAYLSAQIEF